jgi:hypothetical protein
MRSLRLGLAVLALAAGMSAVSLTAAPRAFASGDQSATIGQPKLVALLTAPSATPAPPDAGSGIAATAASTSPTVIFMALGGGFLLTAAVLLFAGRTEAAHARGCRCRACRTRH